MSPTLNSLIRALTPFSPTAYAIHFHARDLPQHEPKTFGCRVRHKSEGRAGINEHFNRLPIHLGVDRYVAGDSDREFEKLLHLAGRRAVRRASADKTDSYRDGRYVRAHCLFPLEKHSTVRFYGFRADANTFPAGVRATAAVNLRYAGRTKRLDRPRLSIILFHLFTSLGEPKMADSSHASSGRATFWTLALCALAALGEGFDIQSMGVAAPRMGPELGLTHAQLGPLFSASVVGLLIGSIIIGRVADSVGRKWTLIVSLATFGVFSAATAFVGGFTPLLIVRFLAGLGLGGAMPNLIALSAEALAAEGVGVDRRTRIVTMITAGMPFGGALAGVVAILAPWRGIFFVGAALPLALAPLMAISLSESRGFETTRHTESQGVERIGVWRGLFGRDRLATTLLLWAATFCALLSLYLLINWLPTLMRAKGVSPRDASLASVLYNLGGALSTFLLAALMEQRRRAAKLAVWYLGMAGSILLLANAASNLASAGGASFIAGVFIASAALPFYGLAPAYYEVEVRGAGVGAALGVGRSGAIVGPLIAGVLLTAGAGAGAVIMALLPLAVAIGAAAMALMGRPTAVEGARRRD